MGDFWAFNLKQWINDIKSFKSLQVKDSPNIYISMYVCVYIIVTHILYVIVTLYIIVIYVIYNGYPSQPWSHSQFKWMELNVHRHEKEVNCLWKCGTIPFNAQIKTMRMLISF